jgi:WD40 repeat protein
MLWDTEKGKLLAELQPGSNSAIYRIDWNPLDPTLIATGSSDSLAFIFQTDGKKLTLIKKIKHPGVVFGVAWSPFQKEILATACQDGHIRIYEMSGTQEKLLNTLQGHTARVFNIVWSPLIPNVIASGSDDKSVRVWDVKQGTSVVLGGHTSNVRALVWNTELPWLLLSGSWDSTINMWDIRDKKCIHVANEHHADVYGIAVHPERPFVYVSCSRDTSVRFWSIERIVAPLLLRVVISNDWKDVLGNPPTGINIQKEALKLSGAVSKKLCSEIEGTETYSVDYFQKIMDFFSYLDYQKEFWDIIKAILKGKNEDPNNRIMSLQNLPITYLVYENVKFSNFFSQELKNLKRLEPNLVSLMTL